MNPSSASKPGGQKQGPPKPGGPLRGLRRKAADPLVARKRPTTTSALSRPPRKPADTALNGTGGLREPADGSGSADGKAKLDRFEAEREAKGGWTTIPPNNDFTEYPLVITKRALREGLRYHVMSFNRRQEDKPVDPTDQDQFPRPVSLHRRDPRLPPAGRMLAKDDGPPANPLDEAEAEKQRILKAEREAQRAIDLAQIAPVAKPNEPKPTKPTKKEKSLSTYYPKHTEAAKKQVGIRYEETLPWHLEDVDGKNVWVGSYVAALSEVNVAFVIHGSGFRMIPLERYYKFNGKQGFHMLSLEEAEKMMGKNASDIGRWVMKDKERADADKEYKDFRSFLTGPARVKVESATSRAIPKTERRDDNDLDISGDEFQDDDEAPGFEADDEDTRDARDRVRRDHLGANLFGQAEEEEVDKEEKEEEREKIRDKLQGKRTRKNLTKLEHAMEYESDSDSDNPFAESSSDSDSEKEKEKEGDDKKDDESKKQADHKDKPASGANTKGNTTPSGKSKLGPDSAKKIKSLKRPGSPNLSESSGNESSRKRKVKKTGASLSVNASRSTTPVPGRSKAGGATSDGEATAGEGSDGGLKPKKIKIKSGTGSKGTPNGSRAGSPTPSGPRANSPSRNQTSQLLQAQVGGSPPPQPPTGSQGDSQAPTGRVQAWEIVQALEGRPNGIVLGELLRMFSHRVSEDNPALMKRQEWIALVKNNAIYGADKLLRPKPKQPNA